MAKLGIGGTAVMALAILTVAWSSAEAQTAPRLAVSVEAGANFGGSGNQLKDTFQAIGMNDVNPFGGGWFGSDPRTPPSTDRYASWSGDVRVRVRPRVSVGLNVSKSNDGSTYGYDAGPQTTFGVSYTAEYSMTTVAPVITCHPTTRLRLGDGPAVQRLKYSSVDTNMHLRKNAVGVLAQAAYMFWDGKSFFSEVTGQYRGVQSMSVPDVTLTAPSFFPSGAPDYTLVVPGGDVPFQNWSVGVSFGMRLR